MKMHLIKNLSMNVIFFCLLNRCDNYLYVFRKQMCRLHLVAIGNGLANSMFYFLHCATFVYGSKLVEHEEMTFDKVFRY